MAHVEIVYVPTVANLRSIVRAKIEFYSGMTVRDALQLVDWFELYPEINQYSFGIFSKEANLDTLVTAGARIEVYQSLHADPKDKRRARAKRSRN